MTEQALCDPEAERSVIGAVLLAPSALRGVLAAGLRPEHFYREAHRQVFATMEHMEGRGQAVDRQTNDITWMAERSASAAFDSCCLFGCRISLCDINCSAKSRADH